MFKWMTDEEKIEVVAKYKTGKYTCTDLAKEYNRTISAISAFLKRRGIKSTYIPHRKYSINHEYFDVVDTEDKAYFLGFLYADGCNYEDRKAVTLSLQEEDKEILDKLNILIGSNRPIKQVKYSSPDHNKKSQFRLAINSERLSQKLALLGMTQRKTFTLKFPTEEQVPSRLIKHFIRGYFDGDGCICWTIPKNANYPKPEISIVSTEEFCIKLLEYLENNLQISGKYKKRHKNRNTTTRQLKISSRKFIHKFMRWIYGDASIFLKRKHDKYQELVEIITSTSDSLGERRIGYKESDKDVS